MYTFFLRDNKAEVSFITLSFVICSICWHSNYPLFIKYLTSNSTFIFTHRLQISCNLSLHSNLKKHVSLFLIFVSFCLDVLLSCLPFNSKCLYIHHNLNSGVNLGFGEWGLFGKILEIFSTSFGKFAWYLEIFGRLGKYSWGWP